MVKWKSRKGNCGLYVVTKCASNVTPAFTLIFYGWLLVKFMEMVMKSFYFTFSLHYYYLLYF